MLAGCAQPPVPTPLSAASSSTRVSSDSTAASWSEAGLATVATHARSDATSQHAATSSREVRPPASTAAIRSGSSSARPTPSSTTALAPKGPGRTPREASHANVAARSATNDSTSRGAKRGHGQLQATRSGPGGAATRAVTPGPTTATSLTVSTPGGLSSASTESLRATTPRSCGGRRRRTTRAGEPAPSRTIGS